MLAEWAVRYARHGWPVFPIRAGQKVPASKHGCLDASANPADIAKWWDKHPDHNIGLATGVAFDVLDLDGEEGEQAYDEWAHAKGVELPLGNAPIVATPGGGIHIYGAPTGAGNRAKMLPCVDWRGKGGYVVAPPSIHPNGGRYEFAEPAFEVCELVAWPQAVRGLVTRSDQAHKGSARVEWQGHGHGTPYGCTALQRICADLANTGEGARNHTLFVAAKRGLELAAGGQILESVAVEFITSAARHCGLGDAEIDRTIKSARRGDIVPCRPA